MSTEDRLRQVFADVFAVDGAAVRDEDSPETIEQWDSIAHLNMVFAIEGEFGIQFEAEEIPGLVSFGSIRDRVEELESAAP